MTSKPVVGLIGGIGSGKSLVAAAFARHGARVVSGDQLGHEALRQPEVIARVVSRFGKDVLDEQGNVSRRRLGARVFADPEERRALEAISFPWIERRFAEENRAAQADPDVALVVFDAAVLLEAGWDKRVDAIVYVYAPRAARLSRLAAQRGWGAKEVQARENAQWPLSEKVARADFVVDNSGPPEDVDRQVVNLVRTLASRERERPEGQAS